MDPAVARVAQERAAKAEMAGTAAVPGTDLTALPGVSEGWAVSAEQAGPDQTLTRPGTAPTAGQAVSEQLDPMRTAPVTAQGRLSGEENPPKSPPKNPRLW
jgi:hypothetical protein